MNLINVGKIVNTFGIKGELKIVSRFQYASKVFKVGNNIYLNGSKFNITGFRFHKNNYLIELNGIKDINDVEKYIGLDVYFGKAELNLSNDEYIISDLLNFKVIENEQEIGIITDYDDNKINPLIKVNNKFYIPLKGSFIKSIDLEKGVIITVNIKNIW